MFYKILAMAILCMLIPLLIDSTLVTEKAIKGMEQNANDTLKSIASKEVLAFSDFVDAQRILTKSISINTSILEAGMNYQETHKFDEQQRGFSEMFLRDIEAEGKGMYENLFITLGSEGYADAFDGKTLHDVSGETYYEACKENGMFIGSAISNTSGKPILIISYAITNPKTGEFMGTVNNSLDLCVLSELLLKDEVYTIALIDRGGNIIAHKDTTQIMGYNLKQADEDNFNNLFNSGSGAQSYTDPYTKKFTYMGYSVADYFMCQVSQTSEMFDIQRKEMTKKWSAYRKGTPFCVIIIRDGRNVII